MLLSFRAHAKATLRLAVPMMLAQGLSLMAYIIDTIMVGQAGGNEIAYLSTGRSFVLVVTMIGIGLLNGIVVFTSRAAGAGNPLLCGRIFRSGLIYALILGVIACLLVSLGGKVLLGLVGLSPDLVEGGGRYLMMMGFCLPATYLFVSSNFFLQGLSRPKPGMWAMILVTPLNICLNAILIYGLWGAPEMGAAGAALATAMTQWLAALGLLIYIRHMSDRDRYGIGRASLGIKSLWIRGRKLRGFGIPLGIATGLEFVGTTVNVMFAGLIGAIVLSGLEVVFNLHLIAFIVCFSMATATSVRVGTAVGAKAFTEIRPIVFAGIGIGMLSMIPFGLAYVLMPDPFFGIFTKNMAIHDVARVMLPFIVVGLFFDAIQFVMLHSLRAAGDQWMASILQVTAFLIVMVPVAWLLAFPAGFGGPGIAAAFMIGAVSAAVLLGGRFLLLHHRDAFRQMAREQG